VLAAAGLVTGTIEYAKGGKFWDGAEKPFDIGEDVCRKVWEWSDENSDYLTRIAINNVMSAATGAAGQEIRHHGHSGGGGS
jgi:hypothetical protein